MANLEIKLSANKRQPYLRHRVVGRVGDGGLTTINVQLLEEDEITPFVINLNGTLKFVGEVSNGNYTEGEPEIIDSTNGLISYTFTKSNFSTSHQFKQAYFEYVDPNGKKVTFQNFIIDVLERVDINSEQAKYYISSLEKLQSEMQTTFNQFISDKQVQYDQIYSKYNELVSLINESDKQANEIAEKVATALAEFTTGDFFSKSESNDMFVSKTADQTIGGQITFAKTPKVEDKKLILNGEAVDLLTSQNIPGNKNFTGALTKSSKPVLTTDDNKYEVVTLTVTNGNNGSAKLYREGKTVTIYFFALNGKSSAGNDSTILTIPEGYRTPISFEQLVGSIDRSTLNSAQLSIGADGAIKWRKNSSYGSDYSFVITYSI